MLYAPAEWWPVAKRHDVTYDGAAQPFTTRPLGWIMHVTVGNGSPWRTFEDAPAGNRRFSHLWIAKDGSAEQYAPLSHDSWAQANGNDSYWSVEFEGFPDEPLTDAQMNTAATLHVWLGVANLIANTPGQRGIGTHQMGGGAWGGHTCPDPAMGLPGPRSRQRGEIIRRAISGGTVTHDPLDTTDLTNIARTEETYYQVTLPDGSHEVRDLAIGECLANSRAILAALKAPVNVTVDVQKLAAAVVAALPAGNPLTAAQVADELARRLTT